MGRVSCRAGRARCRALLTPAQISSLNTCQDKIVRSDVLALFDLDHTLLAIDCDEAWVEFLIEQGAVDRTKFEASNRVVAERYRRGEVGLLEFTEFYLSTLVRHPIDRLEAWREAYLRTKIIPAIPVDSRRLVARHVRDGHLCVMTTAASRFLASPIGHELGFEHVIATEAEMHDGRFTGKVSGLPNMRENKITRLDAWLADRELRLGDFRQSWFYSDSRNDIPLLSMVTNPIAVNPDPALAELAAAKRWPVLQIR
jgi:HAD superfamily hydrolase (TIGR01490 family)